MQFKWNKIKIEGDGNIVIQDADGNVQQLAIGQFIQQFTQEKDERIALLEKTIYDKEKIERLSDGEIQRLSGELDRLLQEKAALETRITQLLSEFSEKDISQAGELYQKAFALFINGKLDEAISLLDDARLEEELSKIDAQEQKVQEEREKLADTHILKAQMLQLRFEFDTAADHFEKAIQILPAWRSYVEAANYFSFLNQFDKAYAYYQRSLLLAKNQNARAASLNNLAVLQRDRNEFSVADKNYQEALEIYRELARIDPQTYLPDVAMTLNNLAILQKNRNEFSAAEKNYQKALEIYRELVRIDLQTYLPDVAMTLNNLAVLQSGKNEFSAAEKNYQEALEIRRELARTDPQTYLPDVATTLNNLAVLQSGKNEFSAAEKNYQEALKIRRELARINPRTYMPSVATTLNNLAVLQKNRNEFLAADKNYQEALEIRRELARINPQTYLPFVAMTLNNLANLQKIKNEFLAAEKNYQEALEIRRELARINPQTYLPDVAMTAANMSLFYSDSLPQKEVSMALAREAYSSALPFVEHLPMARECCDMALSVIENWGEDPKTFLGLDVAAG